MSVLLTILGVLALIGAGWLKMRQRIGKAETKAADKAHEAQVSAVEAEAARGDAAVANATASVIVEALDDQAAGAAAAREVTRAAAEAVDHPDRAAARARAELLPEDSAADDR